MKSICFDVIGTCFDPENVIATIASRLSSKSTTSSNNNDDSQAAAATAAIDARSLFFAWFYAAQRDFTYVSLARSYQPIATVLRATFKRACRIAGLAAGAVTDDDVAAVMQAFVDMPARPGLKACFDGLRQRSSSHPLQSKSARSGAGGGEGEGGDARKEEGGDWDVYAVTNGGAQTSLAYFSRADIALDRAHLLSCDDLRIAKPDARVYENAQRHLTARGLGEGEGERWFVAAHAWDLIAAREAGFKTAWLAFEEFEAVPEVFGEFDLCVGGMEELLVRLREV